MTFQQTERNEEMKEFAHKPIVSRVNLGHKATISETNVPKASWEGKPLRLPTPMFSQLPARSGHSQFLTLNIIEHGLLTFPRASDLQPAIREASQG